MKITPDSAPLSALHISSLNARAHDVGEGDEGLEPMADSIREHGLLNPLTVQRLDKGQFAVLAGRRRYLALKILESRKQASTLLSDIPLRVMDGTESQLAQASVAENQVRSLMTDLDLFKAVRRILDKARKAPTDEMLAQAFGTSVARIQRIVRIAHVHPDIMEAFEEGDIDAKVLRDLARTNDADLQLRVFEGLQSGEISHWNIGDALGFGDREQNRRLEFVGFENYEAAGGQYERDLFSEHDAIKVTNPDILAKLVETQAEEFIEALKAKHSDRELTITWEQPRGADGYVLHELRAHTDYPQDVLDALDAADEKQSAAFEEMEALLEGDHYLWHGDENLRKPAADNPKYQPTDAEKWDKLVAEVIECDAEETKLRESDKVVPDGATVAVLSINHEGLEVDWFFPDAASAGRTESSSTSSAPLPAPPKPGDDDYEPDKPTLTQKAIDYIKAMRVNMAARHTQGPGSLQEESARTAHHALIFSIAWRLMQERWPDTKQLEKTGLNMSFEGDVHGFGGLPLERVPPPDLPGLNHKDPLQGWRKFQSSAKPADIDRLAAWVFAVKMSPVIGADHPKTIVSEVFAGLADHDDARRAVNPDLTDGFFGLFGKKPIAAMLGSVDEELEREALKMKGTGPKEFAAAKLGQAKPDEPTWGWILDALKWRK